MSCSIPVGDSYGNPERKAEEVRTEDEISLIGIRLEVQRDTPEFFFLAFTGDSAMLPLMRDDRILVFTNKRHFRRVISLAGCEESAAEARRNELWFGVGRAIVYLERESIDDWACIIESINLLDDLLIAVNLRRPATYAKHLDALADYLTFDRDLDAFFATASFDRHAACDALRWCIGAVFTRITLLPHIIRERR